jgi:hypothetical protein
VMVPSFRPFVWGYMAMAVLRTVVLLAVAMVGPPQQIPVVHEMNKSFSAFSPRRLAIAPILLLREC